MSSGKVETTEITIRTEKRDPLITGETFSRGPDTYGPVQPKGVSAANAKSKHKETKDGPSVFVKKKNKGDDKEDSKKTKRPKGAKPRSKKSDGIIVPKKRRMQSKKTSGPPRGFFYGVKRAIWFVGTVLLLIAGAYMFVGLQNLDHFGRDIERYAEQKLGLDMTVGGSVDLLMPLIRPGFFMEDVTLRNAADQQETHIRRVEVRLNLMSLFEPKAHLDLIQMRCVGADIALDVRSATSPDLERLVALTNDMLTTMPGWLGNVTMKDLSFVNSHLHLAKPDGTTAFTLPIQEAQFWSENDEVQISVSGRSGIEAYTMGGTVSGIDTLQQGGQASLDLTGALGSSFLILSGELSLADAASSALHFQSLGPDFSGLMGLAGYEALDNTPYLLSVNLEGDVWGQMVGPIAGSVGESNIYGQVNVDNRDLARVNMQISSDYLDLAMLAPFLSDITLVGPEDLGVAPPLAPALALEENAPADATEATEATEAQDDVAPPPMLLGSLEFNAGNVKAGEKDLGPLQFDFMRQEQGGSITLVQGADGYGFAMLSATQQGTAPWTVKATASNFDVGAVVSAVAPEQNLEGVLHLAADVHLADAGEMQGFPIAKGGYQMVLFADRIGGDLEEIISADILDLMQEQGAIAEDADSGLCVLSRATMDNGRLRSHALYLETDEVMTSGSGYMDFSGDDLKLVLRPRPKDPRLLASAIDIEIGGAITEPRIKRNNRKISRGLSSSLSVKTDIDESIALPHLTVARDGEESCLVGLLEVD